jgi:hypothetical protein
LLGHLSEDDYAKNELINLADDTAIITADYKKKILACFFRENQNKWFGKMRYLHVGLHDNNELS